MAVPADSQIAFTVLPGHGYLIVEKWTPGTAPFHAIWEAMDRGHIAVENRVPQRPMRYMPGNGGKLTLMEDDGAFFLFSLIAPVCSIT